MKILAAPFIAMRPGGGLCNVLINIQGAIVAGALDNKKVSVEWRDGRTLFPAVIKWSDLFEPPQAFELSSYSCNIGRQ